MTLAYQPVLIGTKFSRQLGTDTICEEEHHSGGPRDPSSGEAGRCLKLHTCYYLARRLRYERINAAPEVFGAGKIAKINLPETLGHCCSGSVVGGPREYVFTYSLVL